MLRTTQLFIILAGLAGACGVGLAAYAAHLGGGNLQTASQMLLFHAPALLALAALSPSRFRSLGAWVMVLGLVLFCGDLVMRELAGTRLFPMAAPLGGSSLIFAWVLVAASGFAKAR